MKLDGAPTPGDLADGVILVTTVRDGRVYEWQGGCFARIPKSVFDDELWPASEEGALPWGIDVVDWDWDTDTVTIERINEESSQ